MNKKYNFILVSHGNFAKSALESAEMIIGKQENCYAVAVTADKCLQDVITDVSNIYNSLDKENSVIFLADILGGTPSNVITAMILNNKNTYGFAGFNLPILLELLMNQDLNIEELKNIFSKSFVYLNKKLNNDAKR